MPIAIIDVVCAALDIDKKDVEYDYFGLNHFGWFTSIRHKGEEVLPQLREYIKEHEILLPDSYLKGMGSLMAKKPEEATDEHPEQNRHTKGSWYYVWTTTCSRRSSSSIPTPSAPVLTRLRRRARRTSSTASTTTRRPARSTRARSMRAATATGLPTWPSL